MRYYAFSFLHLGAQFPLRSPSPSSRVVGAVAILVEVAGISVLALGDALGEAIGIGKVERVAVGVVVRSRRRGGNIAKN